MPDNDRGASSGQPGGTMIPGGAPRPSAPPVDQPLIVDTNQAFHQMPEQPAQEQQRIEEGSPQLHGGLPPGWRAFKSTECGLTYYKHEESGETAWQIPKKQRLQ